MPKRPAEGAPAFHHVVSMPMNISLLFPPGTDPRAPHLGLPSLAAVLRRDGVRTSMHDLDLEGLLALVSAESLARATKRLRDAQSGPPSERVRRLLGISDYLVTAGTEAVSLLRDPIEFYDPLKHQQARTVLADALELASAANGRVHYNTLPIAYDVDGVDAASLRDLIRVTADPSTNLFLSDWEQHLFPRLEAEAPDIVGISITNRQQIVPGLHLARELRRRNLFVVIGGTVFTKFVDVLKRRPAFFEHFADGVVVYEGESAILALADQMRGARDFSKVPNFLYLSGGEVRHTPISVENVNALPTPDFEGLPLESYLAPEVVLPILTGKGCYFNRCKFCDIPYINHVSKKAYRLREPETVTQDCLTLEARFGCRHFEITDEALSPKLLDRWVDTLLPHSQKRFCFVGYARLEPGFTPSLCERLGEAGFKKLFFGLESASQATLDHMDKGVDIADAVGVLASCRAANINFHVFSMIGFPEETEESAETTFRFFVDNAHVIDHPGNTFDIHPFGLELRTRYFSEAEQMGVFVPAAALGKDFMIGVPSSDWQNTRGLGPARVEELIASYLAQLHRVYRTHHNCPGHLWPGFEEYALLYGDKYATRGFPYMTRLPDESDPRAFRVVRSALTYVEAGPERVTLLGHYGRVETSRTNFELLDVEQEQVFSDLAAALRDSVPEEHAGSVVSLYRDYVHTLVGQGLVSVKLSDAP